MWVCADTVAALNMGGAHCRIPSKVHRTSTGRNPVQCKVQRPFKGDPNMCNTFTLLRPLQGIFVPAELEKLHRPTMASTGGFGRSRSK